jgi:ubiquinone/menaquinone biosynthesis C-methylase UbiE
LRPGAFVVDGGCGLGETAVEMADLVGPSGHVLGIDASAEMVDRATKSVRNLALPIEFRVSDVLQIDLDDDAADAVYCERVMQWLPDPDGALKEMTRVLRPGGRLVVVDTDHSSNAFAVGEDAEASALSLRDYVLDVVPHPRIGSQLHRLLRRAGLDDVAFDVAAVPLSTFMLGWPFLQTAVTAAVARGDLSADRGEALVTSLQEDEATGHFFGYSLLIAASGTKR